MTGAHLSGASRRADGLATSAVLEQNELQAANRAMQSTRRCFEPIRFPPLMGGNVRKDKGGTNPSIKRACEPPLSRIEGGRGKRSETQGDAQSQTQPETTPTDHSTRIPVYVSMPDPKLA